MKKMYGFITFSAIIETAIIIYAYYYEIIEFNEEMMLPLPLRQKNIYICLISRQHERNSDLHLSKELSI